MGEASNRRANIGMLVGLILFAFGPVVGLLPTLIGLAYSFHAVDATVDPSDKARRLAMGISIAMNSTFFGLVLAAIGVVVFFVSLFFRLRNRHARAGPDDSDEAG